MGTGICQHMYILHWENGFETLELGLTGLGLEYYWRWDFDKLGNEIYEKNLG